MEQSTAAVAVPSEQQRPASGNRKPEREFRRRPSALWADVQVGNVDFLQKPKHARA